MSSKSFKDLQVWQKAHLRRPATSIPANIAEGFRRKGNPYKARFYNIAQGSIEECRYSLILAKDLGYGDTRTLERNPEEISRLLEAYARRVGKS